MLSPAAQLKGEMEHNFAEYNMKFDDKALDDALNRLPRRIILYSIQSGLLIKTAAWG